MTDQTGRTVIASGTGIDGPIAFIGDYLATHQHSWQAGPFIEGYFPRDARSVPDSVVLVCDCGELRRVAVPPVEDPR